MLNLDHATDNQELVDEHRAFTFKRWPPKNLMFLADYAYDYMLYHSLNYRGKCDN